MYPQAKASQSVLGSQDYFRLYTELESNGDIYEIDTSIKGLVIGPNSDVQNVRAYYFDSQAGGFIEHLVASVSDPFTGRLDARMETQYPGLGTAGRILVAADDLVPHPDQTWVGPNPNNVVDPLDLIVWNRPYIDLIAYLSEAAELPIARSERQWNYRIRINDRGQGTGVSWYFFPHYRRKYFHARFNCLAAPPVGAVTANVHGITFFPNTDAVPNPAAILLAGALNVPVAAGTTAGFVIYGDRNDVVLPAQAHGFHDYMLVEIRGPEILLGEIAMDIISTDWA